MRPHPNVFHGAAVVTMAGLLVGLALKPAPKTPEPKAADPQATEPVPVHTTRSGPTPWWVTGSDALYGRPDTRLVMVRAEAPVEASAAIEVYPAALDVPPVAAPAPPARYARAAPVAPPPARAGGEWREDADGVYFVPDEEPYPPEPDYGYDPYA